MDIRRFNFNFYTVDKINMYTIMIQIRASVEEKEGRKFDRFIAVRYCTQVVAGVNYFIKVLLN